MQIKRTGIVLSPNSKRVILRPFIPFPEERKLRIIARLSALPEAEVDRLIAQVLEEFHGRHQRPRDFLLARFEKVREYLITDAPLSDNRRLLIGAYFTQEYAVESAALFNPAASSLKRNGEVLLEDFVGGSVTESLARPMVDLVRDVF
jgi:hypothetical protein